MKVLKRRIPWLLPAILCVALVAAALSGCSTPAGSPAATGTPAGTTSGTDANASPSVAADDSNSDFVLRVGYAGSLCEAPLHMAVEKGYFEEEGLKVELVKLAPGTVFDSVTSDQIDVGFTLMASMIQPLSNGLPAKITTGLHTGCDKVLVKKDSGIKTPQDFIGKKVGVPSMTNSPIIFLKRVLADNGIRVTAENSQVEFLVYSNADLANALASGAVDAIALNDPTATIAAKENDLDVVFDSATDAPYKDQYCCVGFVSENIASDYPDIAAKYTRAMQKGSAYVQDHQDEVARIQVDNKWVAGDAAVNAEVLKTFNFIPSVSGAYEAFGITSKQLQTVGMLGKDIDADDLQKNSFVTLDGIPEEYK